MRKIGILGGTFDPVHIAHLMIAEHAYSEVPLDTVWLMPTGISPHKEETEMTPVELREEMITRAIGENPHLSLSRFEVELHAVNYTYKTAELLSEAFPDANFYYIMGADSLQNFAIWREPEIISRYFTLLVAARNGTDISTLSSLLEEYHTRFGTRGQILTVPEFSISATDIRARVAAGKSIRYLTPEPVRIFISEHGLYRSNP